MATGLVAEPAESKEELEMTTKQMLETRFPLIQPQTADNKGSADSHSTRRKGRCSWPGRLGSSAWDPGNPSTRSKGSGSRSRKKNGFTNLFITVAVLSSAVISDTPSLHLL